MAFKGGSSEVVLSLIERDLIKTEHRQCAVILGALQWCCGLHPRCAHHAFSTEPYAMETKNRTSKTRWAVRPGPCLRLFFVMDTFHPKVAW